MNRITTDQQIIDFIKDFHKKNGYAPSFREVGEGVGYKSLSSVYTRLNDLRDKGLVAYRDGDSRTLTVLEEKIGIKKRDCVYFDQVIEIDFDGPTLADEICLKDEVPKHYNEYSCTGCKTYKKRSIDRSV